MHFCPNCLDWVDTEVRKVTETYPVRGENITIEANVRFCKKCNDDLFDETLDTDNLNRAYDIYRQNHKVIPASAIFRIRNSYNLSQVAFSRILGFSDGKIKSLENGSLPTIAESNLLFLVQDSENFSQILELNRTLIEKDEYEAARYALGTIWVERNKN